MRKKKARLQIANATDSAMDLSIHSVIKDTDISEPWSEPLILTNLWPPSMDQ